MPSTITKRAAIAIAATAITTPAAAQSCTVYDPSWMSGIEIVQNGLNSSVAALGTTLTAARSATLETVLSAAKVYTKQESVNGARESNVLASANEALAASLATQARQTAIVDATEQYSGQTGQGVDPCSSIQLMSATVDAIASVEGNGQRLLRELDVSPGKATTLSDASATRLRNANVTDAGALLDPSASDAGRKAVIEHMAGLPAALPGPGSAGAEADLMMTRARRIEALRSPALASLSAVRAMSAPAGHVEGDEAVAPLTQLAELQAKYGGGPGYQEWSAGLAGQSEHGLLLELTRLRSMTLRLQQMQADSNARVATIFATMLAVQAGGDL